MVNKLLAYEGASTNAVWRKKAVLVTDADDASNGLFFHADSDNNIKPYFVSGGFTNYLVYHDTSTTTSDRMNISNYVSTGCAAVTYLGHGNVDMWSNDKIWTNNSVNSLMNTNNSAFPIVAIFTCQSGLFSATNECLAEAFMEANNRGAVATFAPSLLNDNGSGLFMAQGFCQSFAVDKNATLGDAVQAAQLSLFAAMPYADELLAYEIFGDAATLVNPK